MHVAPFDLALPLPALVQRLADRPGLCWLDGSAPHAEGRFSFLASDPVERVCVSLASADPFAALARIERDIETAPHAAVGAAAPAAHEVPRWIGYVAYDAWFAGGRGRLPRPATRPALSFARYDALLAVDHVSSMAWLVGDSA